MNILVFDRSLEVRYSLSKHIQQMESSNNISAVESIASVLMELSTSEYHLIIVDMDNLKGKFLEMMSLLKKNNPDAVVLLLTLFPNKNVIRKFLENGADYCFDKIGQFDQFLITVEDLLKNKQSKIALSKLSVAV